MKINKTKIVCSVGPSCSYVEIFKRMVEAGMDVARINLAHATPADCEQALQLVKEVNESEDAHIAIMYDTKGPDVRVGMMENDGIELIEGNLIHIVKDEIVGNADRFTINYKQAIDIVKVGHTILIEDGLLRLEVIDKETDILTCRILSGGILGNKKKIHVPNVDLEIPFLTEADIADIKYACHHEGDFIALSYVSSKEDVFTVREIIKNEGSEMRIISKIETLKAVKHIDEIIEASNGVMVARGDLGAELSMVDLPIIQKQIIKKCREKGKFCVVATEMLSSMMKKPRPTRAEVSDIANAVLDGTDAVMLSNETTIGDHPVETVRIMSETCEHVERHIDYDHPILPLETPTVRGTIAHSVALAANKLNVAAILATTISGQTAYQISTLRPKAIIIAACTTEKVARSFAFNFGICPCVVPTFKTTDEIIAVAKERSKTLLGLHQGDLVVIAGGFPLTENTNFLKIEEI